MRKRIRSTKQLARKNIVRKTGKLNVKKPKTRDV